MSVTQILISFGYLICWQGYKLRSKLSVLGHVSLLLSLTGTLTNAALARWDDAGGAVSKALGMQYVNLIHTLCVVVSVAGLYVFRLAAERCTIRSRRVLLTLAGAAAVTALFYALTIYSIHHGLVWDYSIKSFTNPYGALFQVATGGYFGGVLFLVGLWMIRYTRSTGKERNTDLATQPTSGKHFRYGMLIAASGIFILSALSIGRAIPAVIVYLGGPDVIAPSFLLGSVSALAFPLVFAGLSYPLLVSRSAAYRAWRHQRPAYRAVTRVWRECETIYPEIVLPSRSLLQRLRRLLWAPERFTRRKFESFDGLAKLLRHSHPARTEVGRRAESELREAVRRYDATHSTNVWEMVAPDTSDEEWSVPAPSGDDNDDLVLLIALAEILDDMARNGRDHVVA